VLSHCNFAMDKACCGFSLARESKQRYPDAWCAECEQARLADGGKWTPAVQAVLSARFSAVLATKTLRHCGMTQGINTHRGTDSYCVRANHNASDHPSARAPTPSRSNPRAFGRAGS
jgi:hypothetical protein